MPTATVRKVDDKELARQAKRLVKEFDAERDALAGAKDVVKEHKDRLATLQADLEALGRGEPLFDAETGEVTDED